MSSRLIVALSTLAALSGSVALAAGPAKEPSYEFNDGHFHLTNYVQEGISLQQYLAIMGSRVGRSVLFGIPVQQQWSYRVTKEVAPTYYLDTDAPLYYYSFTDAYIAMAYLALPKEQRARFDPMITGFNPTDMYAADHIRRVLETFPGVFVGIGEFSIHKEFVSSKIAGDVASLTDPALDRLLDFAAEVGLLVLIHNDVSMPFPKPEQRRVYFDQLKDLFRRHPGATIVWAHLGLGRVVEPLPGHAALIEEILDDPALSHVNFDISWDEAAKYLVRSMDTIERSVGVMGNHPDRFVFGTDVVAPSDPAKYYAVFDMYAPLWRELSPEARRMITRQNYERLFGAARGKVRAWEHGHVHKVAQR
jgi:predicted TIM-barrel fold metal-dependent hydrolase